GKPRTLPRRQLGSRRALAAVPGPSRPPVRAVAAVHGPRPDGRGYVVGKGRIRRGLSPDPAGCPSRAAQSRVSTPVCESVGGGGLEVWIGRPAPGRDAARREPVRCLGRERR